MHPIVHRTESFAWCKKFCKVYRGLHSLDDGWLNRLKIDSKGNSDFLICSRLLQSLTHHYLPVLAMSVIAITVEILGTMQMNARILDKQIHNTSQISRTRDKDPNQAIKERSQLSKSSRAGLISLP